MISLGAVVGIFIVSALVLAWGLGRAARAVGSQRGRMRVGVGAVGLIVLVGGVVEAIGRGAPELGRLPVVVSAGILLLVQMVGVYFVLRWRFGLSAGRTFAPFGVYVGMVVVQLVLLLAVVRPYVTQSYVMPTASMEPTLKPGDRFFVNKRLRPARWDLVAYWNEASPERPMYCKRLVGLPGERIRFEGGGLFVNDQPVAAPAVIAGRLRAGLSRGGGRYHEGETIQLGEDEFFFVGDNVDLSADSRFYGPSKRGAVVGVADLIYWPLGRMRVVR